MSIQAARPYGALVMLLVCGCGGRPVADVSGQITIRGKSPEMDSLIISFVTTEGQPFSAPVAHNGSYTVPGVPVGAIYVGFVVPQPRQRSQPKGSESPEDPKRPPDPRQKMLEIKVAARKSQSAAKANPVPEKYRDPLRSGVTTTLTPGPNTFDFDIK